MILFAVDRQIEQRQFSHSTFELHFLLAGLHSRHPRSGMTHRHLGDVQFPQPYNLRQ
jgi:hypothetical protein